MDDQLLINSSKSTSESSLELMNNLRNSLEPNPNEHPVAVRSNTTQTDTWQRRLIETESYPVTGAAQLNRTRPIVRHSCSDPHFSSFEKNKDHAGDAATGSNVALAQMSAYLQLMLEDPKSRKGSKKKGSTTTLIQAMNDGTGTPIEPKQPRTVSLRKRITNSGIWYIGSSRNSSGVATPKRGVHSVQRPNHAFGGQTSPPPRSRGNVPFVFASDDSGTPKTVTSLQRTEYGGTGGGTKHELLVPNRQKRLFCWLRQYLYCIVGETLTLDAFVKAASDEEFLFTLFELFDESDNGCLHHDQWITALKTKIGDDRESWQWVECLDTAACAITGADGLITPSVFATIFRTRGILVKLFCLLEQTKDGCAHIHSVMDFIASLSVAKTPTTLTNEKLQWLQKVFRQTAHGDEICLDDFKNIVQSKNMFFTERVFHVFDRDGSGSVSLQEFLDAMTKFASQGADDKIKFLFDIYDLDGDGTIEHSELKHVICACMDENGMKFNEQQVHDLTTALFEDADPASTGGITFDALKVQLEKHPGLLENVSCSVERWLVPPNPNKKSVGLVCPPLGCCKSGADKKQPSSVKAKSEPLINWRYFRNNYVYLVFLFLYLSANVTLFVTRVLQVAYTKNMAFIVAKACGQCLNFNCMFVLILMLRKCITWLRSHGGSAFLPLDQHIYLHKVTGYFILIFALGHTAGHFVNFAVLSSTTNAKYSFFQHLFTTSPGLSDWFFGTVAITGDILLLILFIMILCSLPCVRKGGKFEVFYWSHYLYVPFWILLLMHGPRFYQWFVVPGLIYLVERVVRFIRMESGHGKTVVSEGVLLPSKVTHLVIKRPSNFFFRPGDYIFVNIPAIAKYEWHPFTISSAPEQNDFIWLHIRAVGEWTNRLHRFMDKEQKKILETQRKISEVSFAPLTFNNSSSPDERHAQTMRTQAYSKPLSDAIHVIITPDESSRPTSVISQDDDQLSPLPLNKLSLGNSTHRQRKGFVNQLCDINDDVGIINKAFSASQLENYHGCRKLSRIHNSDADEDLAEAEETEQHENCTAGPRHMNSNRTDTAIVLMEPEPTFTPANRVRISMSKSLPLMDDIGEEEKRDKNICTNQNTSNLANMGSSCTSLTPSEVLPEGRGFSSSFMPSVRSRSRGQSFKHVRNPPSVVRFNTLGEGEGNRPIAVEKNHLNEITIVGASAKVNSTTVREQVGMADTMVVTSGDEELILPTSKPLEIYIDGPFGSPSSHIFRAEHAILIATGIGVTPFASILQSIMHRYWEGKHVCPKCNYSWTGELPNTVMNLKKVDFFWINRDQRSFEWFVNLLSQLEIEQAEQGSAMERFLDMHMYITSALQKTDMKALGLQLALDLLHEKEKRDLITGLKTRTQAGRPNWSKVFKQMQAQKKGKITVFFCGPPELGKTLKKKCDEFEFTFRKEIF